MKPIKVICTTSDNLQTLQENLLGLVGKHIVYKTFEKQKATVQIFNVGEVFPTNFLNHSKGEPVFQFDVEYGNEDTKGRRSIITYKFMISQKDFSKNHLEKYLYMENRTHPFVYFESDGLIHEYICCSANYYDDGKKYPHQPININKGFVVTGLRHHSCYATVAAIAGLDEAIRIRYSRLNKSEKEHQGFLTSKNRFVNRIEAAEIAFEAGQIKERIKKLHSEDLY